MESLCYSAKGSNDAYDVSVSLTPHPCTPFVPGYAGTRRTCVSTCARGAGIHGDVLIVSHHTTPHTQQNTTHEDRERRQRQREERGRERRRKTETERREREREKRKKTETETRQDEERRDKRQETRDEREDETQDERI